MSRRGAHPHGGKNERRKPHENPDLRPLAHITPIGVHTQIAVSTERLTDAFLENEHTVGGAGSPIHHAVGLIGRIVKIVHADLPGDHAHERRVFVFGDLAVEQDDDAVARHLRGVAVRGVDEIFDTGQSGADDSREICAGRDMVCVQRTQAAERDIAIVDE